MLEKEFLDFGYSKEEYEKLIYSYALKNYHGETLLLKFRQISQLLISFGYTKNEVIKMTVSLPAIYSYSIENIKQKLDDMEALGYARAQVLKMTISSPQIYSYSIENIKQKIADMEALGYTRAQVLKMTVSLPSIYSLSIEIF